MKFFRIFKLSKFIFQSQQMNFLIKKDDAFTNENKRFVK